MLELFKRQTTLTKNQWKIFTACVFSVTLDFLIFSHKLCIGILR